MDEPVRAVGVVAALTAVTVSVAHFLAVVVFDRDQPWLQAGTADSLWEWAATSALGLCALAAAALALSGDVARPRWTVVAVGLFLAFLADAFAVSDRVGNAANAGIVLVLAVVLVLLWSLAKTLGPSASTARVALVLLVGSVAFRVAEPLFDSLDLEHGDVAYEAKVVAKHVLELTGWLLLALALVPEALSRSRGPARRAAAEDGGTG